MGISISWSMNWPKGAVYRLSIYLQSFENQPFGALKWHYGNNNQFQKMAFGYRDHHDALFPVPGVQFLFPRGSCWVFAVFRGIADHSFSSDVAVQFFLQFGKTV